jgi:hypothetical protein
MACNGFNHPPDCVCNFRGGHPGSQPPRPIPSATLLGCLAPPSERRIFESRQAARCRKCGMPIQYVPGPKGGSFIAAGDGSFLRHSCPKAVPTRPLRLRAAQWRRDWFPAGLSAAKGRGTGQLINVLALAEGGPIKVRIEDGLRVDTDQPVVCRWSPEDKRVLEISYLDAHTGELSGTRVRARRLRCR